MLLELIKVSSPPSSLSAGRHSNATLYLRTCIGFRALNFVFWIWGFTWQHWESTISPPPPAQQVSVKGNLPDTERNQSSSWDEEDDDCALRILYLYEKNICMCNVFIAGKRLLETSNFSTGSWKSMTHSSRSDTKKITDHSLGGS